MNPHALLAVWAHRNDVALRKMLQFRDDTASAVVSEVVEEVVTVPAGTGQADLYEPRPHILGRSVDADGAGGVERGVLHELVARQ
jgi:hypothetical protein